MTKITIKPLLRGLKQHYMAPQQRVFKQFRLGLGLFFCGMVTIYAAHTIWPPSLQQELCTLLGLSLVASGFVIAMAAQIRMLISRLIRFFTEN